MKTRANIVEMLKAYGLNAKCVALVRNDVREAMVLAGVINALGQRGIVNIELCDSTRRSAGEAILTPEEEQELVFALEAGGIQEKPAETVASFRERGLLVALFILAKVEVKKKAEQQSSDEPNGQQLDGVVSQQVAGQQ